MPRHPFVIQANGLALQRRAALATLAAVVTVMPAAKAHRFAIQHLFLFRRQHGVQVVQGREARFHAGGALLLALDALLHALGSGQGGQLAVLGPGVRIRTPNRLARRQEGGEGRFLLRRQLQLGTQFGGMLRLAFGAPGLVLGFEGCTLFGADGVGMAACRWLHGGGLGDSGAGDAEGGQGDQDIFANRVHFQVLLGV
jgi:hypothetical protein